MVAAIAIAVWLGLAELALRVVYSDGMSCATHVGPLVARFERDYRIGVWLNAPSYEDYMYARYSRGALDWRMFATVFHAWADEAKGLTPHVLVVLYPYLEPSPMCRFASSTPG